MKKKLSIRLTDLYKADQAQEYERSFVSTITTALDRGNASHLAQKVQTRQGW
jgi:hypothetical protein